MVIFMMNRILSTFGRENVFSFVQRLSQSFMFPIAMMPIAGFLLAIGASFTQDVILANLGLTPWIHEGTLLYQIFFLMETVGKVIIDNLALLFAISVAIGFSDTKKEIASLSAIISFISLHTTIFFLLFITGIVTATGDFVPGVNQGMFTVVLGIPTLQIGVFGGIILGYVVAKINNRYNEIELPSMLSFFEGSNFIPIASIIVSMFLGVLFFIIWPYIQTGISYMSIYISGTGALGAFLFSTIKRLLIPFGLHHVFYLPFWQTSLGGTAVIDGITYVGAQNIYFAQLASPSVAHISPAVTQYFGGEFAAMIFGLPAGAYAIYRHTAKKYKKSTKSAMQSAAVTSMIVGITEPIEFQVIPVAPLLFIFHAIMCGVCNAVQYSLNFAVGCTFSSGLLDLVFLGILPGASRTSWYWIIPIGIVMAVIYYMAFTITITKFHVKFPTQMDDSDDIRLSDEKRSQLIVEGLGGISNIENYTSCATRLRCDVVNPDLVDREILRKTNVISVQQVDNSLQLVYGTKVNVIRSKLEQYINGMSDLEADDNLIEIGSPLAGEVVMLNKVPDETFSSGILGDGIAIDPSDGEVKAPCDGKIVFIAPTKHAFGFECDNGVSLLVHLGIDTVKLDGKGFECLKNEGDHVTKGTTIIKMDLDYIKDQGLSTISPVVCSELSDDEKIVNKSTSKYIKHQDNIFDISKV